MTIRFRFPELRAVAADLDSLRLGPVSTDRGAPLGFAGYVDLFCGWIPGRRTLLPTAGFPAKRSIARATPARRRAYERHRAARLRPHVQRLQELLNP